MTTDVLINRDAASERRKRPFVAIGPLTEETVYADFRHSGIIFEIKSAAIDQAIRVAYRTAEAN